MVNFANPSVLCINWICINWISHYLTSTVYVFHIIGVLLPSLFIQPVSLILTDFSSLRGLQVVASNRERNLFKYMTMTTTATVNPGTLPSVYENHRCKKNKVHEFLCLYRYIYDSVDLPVFVYNLTLSIFQYSCA